MVALLDKQARQPPRLGDPENSQPASRSFSAGTKVEFWTHTGALVTVTLAEGTSHSGEQPIPAAKAVIAEVAAARQPKSKPGMERSRDDGETFWSWALPG